MALYTNTLTCTCAELQTALSGTGTLTANTSISISDPKNVILGDSSTTGTLGNIVSSYSGEYLIDFTPSDFSSAQYTANSTKLFRNCSALSGMCKLPNSINTASSMFQYCSSITSIDTSSFINLTDTSFMFYNCSELKDIDTSSFLNVINSSYMFYGCANLTNINTNMLSNVENASGMFYGCTELDGVDISILSKATNISQMFYNCENLKSIYAINCIFNISTEPTSNNSFLKNISSSCTFYVSPDSYDTWYSRLYTNYAKWGLTTAITPIINKVYIYRRIA